MASGFDVSRHGARRGSSRLPNRGQLPATMAVIGCCLLVSACGFYTADEITATVVDADTKEPIAGVNVIAEWVVEGGFSLHSTEILGYMNVMETVTDQNGRFHFPGWGPRPNFHFGAVFQQAPLLVFFKPGYEYAGADNYGKSLTAAPRRMTSDWDGKTISMRRRLSSVLIRDALEIPMSTQLENLWSLGEWSHIPHFLCALSPDNDFSPERQIFKNAYSWKYLAQRSIRCDKIRD